MKTSDLALLAVVGVGGYWLWQKAASAVPSLGPPSDALMEYRNQQVKPAVWETPLAQLGEWINEVFAPDLVTQGMSASEAEHWALEAVKEMEREQKRQEMYERIGDNSAL